AVLDRGLDGVRVWSAFESAEQFYVGRLRARGVCRLKFDPSLRDQIIEIKDHNGETRKIRVVRGAKFKTGNCLFLATNLLDQQKYDRKALLNLYKKRQSVEDVFLNLKQTLSVKNIRSKKINGVLQEIYAALVMTA